MTTLPPEDQNPAGSADASSSAGAGAAPGSQPPQPPQYEAPQQPQYEAPQAPHYQQAPQAPQYQAPQQPQYQAPGAGQTPPPGGYQQQPQGYGQPTDPALNNVTLNYWLSVFFTWIPALIFFLIEKDKGNAKARYFHVENLNFSLVRAGLGIAIAILSFIPYLGVLVAIFGWIAQIVLFVFHIIAAVKAPEAYRRNEQKIFLFNIPLVK